MVTRSLDQFFQALHNDPALRAELNHALADVSTRAQAIDRLAELGKRHGYGVTTADCEQAIDRARDLSTGTVELTDEELSMVAGGVGVVPDVEYWNSVTLGSDSPVERLVRSLPPGIFNE